MSDSVVVHAEEAFERRRRQHEIDKMARFYLVFHAQLESYLVLARCSYEERLKFHRNCKMIYDKIVRQIVEQNKSPYETDFAEFLELFKSEITINPVFTSIVSTEIVELLQHSHDSL